MLRGWDEGYDIPAFGVAVDPDYRRRGIARKLLRHALALARERGSQTVMIKVHGQNPRARELYASEGFVFAETPDQHGQYWGLREL
jgi:ribosomal protein S18 acetylase RimI-like enzyme